MREPTHFAVPATNPPHNTDLGWCVVRRGFGREDYGDGYMTEHIAVLRAAARGCGLRADTIPNR